MKLGLIGTHITESQSPELHRVAGRLCGIELTYDLIQLVKDIMGSILHAHSKKQ